MSRAKVGFKMPPVIKNRGEIRLAHIGIDDYEK